MMPQQSTAPIPTLRLFCGESPQAVADLTLRQIWELHVQPDMVNPAAKTLEEFTTVLSHWRALTGDPPGSMISREVLRAFQRSLLAGKNSRSGRRSAATVNKILRTMRPLIARCWPKDSHNPDGLGLCDYFRYPPALKFQKSIPRVLSDDEITRLWTAADAPRWRSRGEKRLPADLWRAAMLLHFNCGPRTFDLLTWQWDAIDWSFSRLGCDATIEFVATKTKKTQRLPLNATCVAALRKIAPPGKPPSSLAGPIWPGWTRSNSSQVRKAWKTICEAAGVVCVEEDWRKTCNTRHEANYRGVGPWVLGHGTSGVNATNYYNATDDILRAMASLPQPRCFADWVG